MPYITEKDLINLHSQREESVEKLDKFIVNYQQKERDLKKSTKHKRIYLFLTMVLLLLLVTATTLYFVKPLLIVNYQWLSKNNLQLIQKDSLRSLQTEKSAAVETTTEDSIYEDPAYESSQQTMQELQGDDLDKIIYSVQIAALEKTKVPTLADRAFELNEHAGGRYLKFSIGNFHNYEQAKALKKILKHWKLRGAFIVAHKNGQRMHIKEALKQTTQLNQIKR